MDHISKEMSRIKFNQLLERQLADFRGNKHHLTPMIKGGKPLKQKTAISPTPAAKKVLFNRPTMQGAVAEPKEFQPVSLPVSLTYPLSSAGMAQLEIWMNFPNSPPAKCFVQKVKEFKVVHGIKSPRSNLPILLDRLFENSAVAQYTWIGLGRAKSIENSKMFKKINEHFFEDDPDRKIFCSAMRNYREKLLKNMRIRK